MLSGGGGGDGGGALAVIVLADHDQGDLIASPRVWVVHTYMPSMIYTYGIRFLRGAGSETTSKESYIHTYLQPPFFVATKHLECSESRAVSFERLPYSGRAGAWWETPCELVHQFQRSREYVYMYLRPVAMMQAVGSSSSSSSPPSLERGESRAGRTP